MTRVAIVASSPTERGRLEAIVRASGSLVASAVAASVEALVAHPGLPASEVALLHAPNGVAARELDAMPPIPVVALVGGRTGRAAIPTILGAGVRGVLPDDATAEEISAALDAAAAGLVVVPPEAVSALAASRPGVPDGARGFAATATSSSAAPPLTPREREVLSMLADGLPNKVIAARLGISEHTVKTHLEAIFDKLGASTRAEAVARGVRRGLLLL